MGHAIWVKTLAIETCPGNKMCVAEMRMLRYMNGSTLKDTIRKYCKKFSEVRGDSD